MKKIISKLSSSLFTGHLMWWMKLWPLTPLIIVAILVGCLIAVIILICIIICMCRRRRKRSSKSKKSFPKCEIQNEKLRRSLFFGGLIVNFIFHFFFVIPQVWRSRWWIINRTILTPNHARIMRIYRFTACRIHRRR